METTIEIKHFLGQVLFSHAEENNTIRKTVEEAVKKGVSLRETDLRGADLRIVNLRGVNLYGADLRGADLRGTDLSGVYLYGADLRGVDLRCANLKGADLSGADLSNADFWCADPSGVSLTDANLSETNLSDVGLTSSSKRHIQVVHIGSEKRATTYCFDDDIVWCGRFTGTLEEFEERVKEVHGENKQYLDEYLGFIEYVKFLQEKTEIK